ncbi:COG3014 family protein [Gracilimonas mengyeensis]|nr:hypothetical protein [Gracilimonas mengyeensis]
MASKLRLHNFLYHSICLAALLLLSGCHAYILDDAQQDLRSSFTAGDYERSTQLLEKFKSDDVYKGKDAVLKNLESGMVHHFAGNYDSSNVFFDKSEKQIDDAYTKSISRGLASLLVNDNTLVYDGEPYEDVYLNAFKSLNYVQLGDWEAALVETRRMAFKMEQLDIRIKGLAEAFAQKDTTGKVDWSSGEVNIQNSAFSHYLAAVLYAKTGKPDDARIEFEKLGTALQEQSRLTERETSLKELERIREPQNYNVLISAFSGQAPIKQQEDFRLWLDAEDGEGSFYVKFSIPTIHLYPSRVYSIRAKIDETYIPLHLIEEMDVVSKEVYKAKKPVIYARSLLRATVKATGSTLIASSVRKENKGLGLLVDILGIIGQEATEKADLRGWQTMPGKAWMNVIELPPGNHPIEIQYLSRTGRVLFTEHQSITVEENTALELVESIYSQ